MIGGRYAPAVVRVKEVTVGRGVRGKMGEVQGLIATSDPPSGRMPAVAKRGAPAAKKRNPTGSATSGAAPGAEGPVWISGGGEVCGQDAESGVAELGRVGRMGSGGCAGVGEGAGSLTEWLDRPSHTTIGYMHDGA